MNQPQKNEADASVTRGHAPDLESVISLLDYAEETVEEAREGVRSVRRNLDRAEDSLRRMDAAIEVLRQHITSVPPFSGRWNPPSKGSQGGGADRKAAPELGSRQVEVQAPTSVGRPPARTAWAELVDHLWSEHRATPADLPDVHLRRRLADELHDELHRREEE